MSKITIFIYAWFDYGENQDEPFVQAGNQVKRMNFLRTRIISVKKRAEIDNALAEKINWLNTKPP